MLTVDRLRLQLPRGFEGRADTIARLVGRELSRQPWVGPADFDRLQAEVPGVAAGLTDHDVARSIAGAIREAAGGGGLR